MNTDSLLPEAFVSMLQTLIPSDASHVLSILENKRPTTFRINTLKADVHKLLTQLSKLGVQHEEVSWNHLAYILRSPSQKEFSELAPYKDGQVYLQSLSSMLPALILDPKPGEKILDIAAAPGSKTTQIAALMSNQGEIIANDTSPVRRYRLEANLKAQGVSIAKITKDDGRSIWQKHPEYFDRVLADVPCSMEGRFLTTDPKTYQDWSPKKVKVLANLQRWILRSAISATKVGGTIVYSTCTISPQENEEVIDWILKKEKGAVEIESIEVAHLEYSEGVTSYAGKTYDPSISNCMRIYPSASMEGFFVAKLKKVKSTVHVSED